MESAKIGKIKISRVDEVEGPMMNPTDLFSDAAEERLQKHRHWLTPHFLDPNGILIMSIHGYLVETSRYKILVDPGVGRDKKQKGKDGRFLQNLRKMGVGSNQIDYVLFTHMHSDHIGWNTILEGDSWVPTFPNAKYLFVRPEWDYWRNIDTAYEQQLVRENLIPITATGNSVQVDMDHVIDNEASLEPSPGHTPGHVSLRLVSDEKQAVLVGDVFHHPVQFAEPEWECVFTWKDGNPEQARTTRRDLLNRYSNTQVLILPAHFATPTAGYSIGYADNWEFQV